MCFTPRQCRRSLSRLILNSAFLQPKQILISSFFDLMGIEYKIEFQYKDCVKLAEILRAVPFFANYNESLKFYEYRANAKTDLTVMPDAHAKIESNGIYFCNNCGTVSQEVWSHLVKSIKVEYGQLKIEEL